MLKQRGNKNYWAKIFLDYIGGLENSPAFKKINEEYGELTSEQIQQLAEAKADYINKIAKISNCSF